uniref:Acyl carrier protein n=1 Tax=Streptomyces sp. NBC_00008 TaxID=2903610 RepID=A0AAU2W2P2_9ACTN
MTSNTQVALDKEELRSLIAHILDLDVEEITDDADFVRDLEVDSLMVLEIVVRIQRQYGVKLEERDLKNVSSLPQVLRLISVRRTEQLAA